MRALAKPSVSVWAINQAARSDKDGVRALLEAGEALRHAQAALLAQESGGEALRGAQGTLNAATARLKQSARRALEQADKPAGQAQLDRIGRTLRAAAVSEPAQDDLRNGRMTGELEPAGFEALAALALPARPGGQRVTSLPSGAAPRKSTSSRGRQRGRRLGRLSAVPAMPNGKPLKRRRPRRRSAQRRTGHAPQQTTPQPHSKISDRQRQLAVRKLS